MKKVVVIFFMLFSSASFAQQRQVSISEIDNRAKSIESAAPEILAYNLTKDYYTEKEKLRSIFSWITDHISYRVKKNYGQVPIARSSRASFTDTSKWISANDFVAATVLQNQSAVCDGYARLFKTLCDYAGLRSAVITGFAKGDYNRQFTFRCNHTWNAVYIDSTWRLLDLTWASGYTNYRGDEFVKRLDETYYLPSPEDFIRDHFPDDIRWALMNKPPFPEELKNDPYRNKCFSKYKINAFFPASGIIEAAIGDTIQINLETADPKQDGKMSSDTVQVFDDALQKINATVALLEPIAITAAEKKLNYTFVVYDDIIEWLHIIYNHDTILRYRLKIKKEPRIAQANLPAIVGSMASSKP